MTFVGGPYETLAATADPLCDGASLIIRNCSYFGKIEAMDRVPTISLVQDIFADGPYREKQLNVLSSSMKAVFNSAFTKSQYIVNFPEDNHNLIIPLPVDFSLFEPQNPFGCQQALGLPDNCVLWIGASREAGMVKGWDLMQTIVRHNPDINFVGVFKDKIPDWFPPNMKCYEQLTHEELVKVIGACRVGICTSRQESQHLAGIEMGACGLPMIAPEVGCYWHREQPGLTLITGPSLPSYTAAIRAALVAPTPPGGSYAIREAWRHDFDRPVIRAQWEKLVLEVEHDPTRQRD
jgi:glycosyltransferase involved in cell wall biosynthesis